MFENFAASVAPKSFNLERYLAKSKQVTKINAKIAKTINQKLEEEASFYKRSGNLATAYGCYAGTIISIVDSDFAKSLYMAVTSENFNERLNAAYDNIKCFSNMKFFINKKKQVVSFVYYSCKLDKSKTFFCSAYDNIQQLIALFSSSESTVRVDYYELFRKFLYGASNTSFLTAFFTSVIPEEYPYDVDKLGNIITLFLSFDQLSSELHTSVPGMYLENVDMFFNESNWPRNICINMLRYIYNKNAFTSYDEFFRKHDTNRSIADLESFETFNFVFDENVLESALTISSDTDEMTTYTGWNSDKHKHIVVKIKDLEHTKLYLDNTYECYESGFLHTWTVVPNATKDAVYLFFSMPSSINLYNMIATDDYASVTKMMQTIAKRKWDFSFKPEAPLLKCFYGNYDTLYLDPMYIHQLDFKNVSKTLDYKLIILSIIQEFVKSRNINVANIYTYSFMKIFPPNFAKNIISYLQSGTLLDENTDNWGDILTFGDLSCIRFLRNLSRLNPDHISFFSDVHSDSRVQKILSKKSLSLENDYINSSECLQYIGDIGLELTDDTLAKIFASAESLSLHPIKVIVSEDLCVLNSYRIVGVVWDKCGLTTIGNLIQNGKVDTIVFYKLLSSLLYIQPNHSWVIDKSNICQMLVDKDYNVFLNHNGLKLYQNNREIDEERHFNDLFEALKAQLDFGIPLEHFSYDELYDNGNLSKSRNVLLCNEHNLYYIEGSLCPECRKVFVIIDKDSLDLLYGDDDWRFFKNSYRNSLICGHFGNSLNTWIINQCKLGIQNNLFDKFFFKPDSLAICNNKVTDVMYFGFGDFNFNNLLPISMFKSKQRLQVVQVIYKKLLPLILDGSCIVDKKAFFDSIAMHKDYKGELIILKLPFMNCEAILAKDKDAMKQTKLMFANFLVDYIKSDPSLCAASTVKASTLSKLIKDINSLKFSTEILEECLSAFCDVHNIPFSSKNTLCPLCIADGINLDDIIILPDSHFEALQQNKATFEGGEATLYPYSEKQIQKLFKPGVDLVLKSKIIGKALQKRAQFKAFNEEHTEIKFITIDKVLYESSRNSIKLKGFIQEEIEDSFKISCLKDKDFVKSQGYTQYDIADILIKVCIGIEFLHSIGGYIGDLNGGNILIKGKTVYFIDMDGMSFDEVRNFVYTDMYIYPPSAENKNITKDDDWYSLAIQAFYYFTYSHPFRGISSLKLLPEDEITRMKLGKSVLGNHGINVPNISIGWDFMPNELVTFFINTFEGQKRESMRNILEKFKTSLEVQAPTSTMKFIEVNRLSPCRFALSYNTYINTSGDLLWCERKLLSFSSGTVSCKITGDYIILTTPNNSVVVNDITGQFNIYSAISKDDMVYGANNKLYYISSSDNNVHVKQISSRTKQESDWIVVNSSTLAPFNFLVTDERKFIFLVRNEHSITIYCNLEELTSIDVSSLGDSVKTRLFYDSESGNYLVLLSGCNQTIGVLISSDGSHSVFNLQDEFSNSSCFYKNTLYYMIGDTIYFYNVIDNTQKKFTSQFAAEGCLIERRSNRFVICSKEKTYMYVKS